MSVKTILITGSTSGIGKGIAKKFASEGYNIIFNGIEKDAPQFIAEYEKEYKIKTIYSSANMLKPDEISKMINEGKKKFNRIDVLINNAGIQHVAPIEEFDTKHWNDIIGINLTAAFHCSKTVWKGMKNNKWGRIINIASAHGLIASEFKCAYVASKHGIVGLTKVLAIEGAGHGITVNAICPGYVKTPLVEDQIAEQAKAHNLSKERVIDEVMLVEQPIKKFTKVEDIAEMAFFLCGNHSNTITGASLSIDGGWTAH